MSRDIKITKPVGTKIVDLDGKGSVSFKTVADEQIARIENRFKQSSGQETKTFDLLFNLLREMNERLSALENQS